jgi:hypothetical protein
MIFLLLPLLDEVGGDYVYLLQVVNIQEALHILVGHVRWQFEPAATQCLLRLAS